MLKFIIILEKHVGFLDKFKKKDKKIEIDPERHSYIHVLTDDIRTTFVADLHEYSESNQKIRMIEYSTTTEMINQGINKYGDRYVGTFDLFNFDKPKPKQLISRCSYDELTDVFNWRHKGKLNYETGFILNTDITELSLLQKKFFHVTSELLTFYPMSTSPDDPDYEYNVNHPAKMQFGPPYEYIGPYGKPFGDFHQRLIYDGILICLYFLYWSDDNNEKTKRKSEITEQIKKYENFTKLPEFKIHELNEILDTISN